MKENSTTKPRLYVSTWSLSRACHAIMGLGVCKIALFVALGFGYTLPDFGLFSPLPDNERTQEDSTTGDSKAKQGWSVIKEALKAHKSASTPATSTAPTPKSTEDISRLVDKITVPDLNVNDTQQATPQENSQLQPDPQGSAAVRAAVAHKSKYSLRDDSLETTLGAVPLPQILRQAQNGTPSQNTDNAVYNAPKAEIPEAEDTSWWNNIFSINSLPFPRLGLDQVAYAATLDIPPPPPPPATGNNSSPFTPPAQLAPVQSQILPAGVAGPQMNPMPNNNPLVLPSTPPAPNIAPYVAPESAKQKEQELARREQEILALKQQMEQRLQELQNAERKVKGMLNEAKNVENNKMKTLTNMYVNMKPRQAGLALEKLDENIAARILASMKSKQAGEILSYMNPEVTAKITELLTRMRLGQ